MQLKRVQGNVFKFDLWIGLQVIDSQSEIVVSLVRKRSYTGHIGHLT